MFTLFRPRTRRDAPTQNNALGTYIRVGDTESLPTPGVYVYGTRLHGPIRDSHPKSLADPSLRAPQTQLADTP